MFQQFSIEFTGFYRIFRSPRGEDKTRFCIYETDLSRFCKNAKNSGKKEGLVEWIKDQAEMNKIWCNKSFPETSA